MQTIAIKINSYKYNGVTNKTNSQEYMGTYGRKNTNHFVLLNIEGFFLR